MQPIEQCWDELAADVVSHHYFDDFGREFGYGTQIDLEDRKRGRVRGLQERCDGVEMVLHTA